MAELTLRDVSALFRHAQRALLLAILAPGTLLAHSPAEALKRFKPADGLNVSLFAAEPEIRQPVAINYDERGRLWVVQYLQYPNPAGLKKVRVDQFLRTVFDRVPEPPPHGPKGADRITICEDTDGDGRADRYKDFVSGLNMATGVAIGYGGVFVAQSPYLLFYADRNRDDVPDGDPEVCVAGFGMEDSHAYPNSLQIGPDGWLYGAQGSNVWARVKVAVAPNGQTYAVRDQGSGVRGQKDTERSSTSPQSLAPSPSLPTRTLEFNQCIWRYHPPTRRFEVFAEGGGNTWGLDFDRNGQIIAGTNFGGVCGLHMVQGGYYVKGFAKHGPLSNPHAYGYFEHIPYASPQRISQGEHIMCGGIVYQGGALGPEIENQYVTCALLHRAIYWHKLIPDRSTFKSDFGGTLLSSDDPEFRPVDLALTPDGAVMIADWCDVRANHVLPEDSWNKTNGRIWRLAKKGTPPAKPRDLAKLTTAELVDLLSAPNAWHRREARRVLAERSPDKQILFKLNEMAFGRRPSPCALDALWTMYRLDGFFGKFHRALKHPQPQIRAWAVRLVGDQRPSTFDSAIPALTDLARVETDATVRSQLASTAARLQSRGALRIVAELAQRSENADDPLLPLLLWWAVERHAVATPAAVRGRLLPSSDAWQWPIMRDVLISRLARRYAVEANEAGFAACAKLLALAPNEASAKLVLVGMDQGLAGRRFEKLPRSLAELDTIIKRTPSPDPAAVRLGLRLGSEPAYRSALSLLADERAAASDRQVLVEIIGQFARADVVSRLLELLDGKNPDGLRAAALTALSRYQDDAIAAQILERCGKRPTALRTQAIGLLASRKSWAAHLLAAVGAGKVAAREITADLAQTIHQHGSPELDRLIETHVGTFQTQTSAEKQAQITRITVTLTKGSGNPARGKELAVKHCTTCHTLFNEGNKIGPDLTTADRGNRALMLAGIVDPNLAIRQEYAASTVLTVDGQVLTGIMVENTPASVTLVDAKNQKTTVPRQQIDQLKPATQSLMPEKILDPLSDGELRDLFAYLETGVNVVSQPSQIVSTFDRDTEDWLLEENGPVVKPEHHVTGGNPTGFAAIRDSDAGDVRAVAPQTFLGDLSRFAGGNVWFDARRIDDPTSGKPHPTFGTLTITDGRRTLKQDLFHPNIRTARSEWTRFSGRITPEAFATDAATLAAVLASVTRITVTLEAIAGARETIGFDNFAIQASR